MPSRGVRRAYRRQIGALLVMGLGAAVSTASGHWACGRWHSGACALCRWLWGITSQ